MCRKKRGMIVIPNEKDELVSTRPVNALRVFMDYRNLNSWIEKDHFLDSFLTQILDPVAGKGGATS